MVGLGDLKSHGMVWVGRDLKAHLDPTPCMGRDTSHQPRLLQAPSNLPFNTARDGAATASLGNLGQALTPLTGQNSFSAILLQMSKQLDMFKTNLEEFASKHKQEIRKNPEFRVQFQDMCATIGVDPLASGKGFWAEMLGVGDFYYELGVQIIEVCLALKHRNGGLITLEELHQQVLKGRGKFAQDVSQDDLLRAIKKLKVLGNGFGIIPVGGTYLIQSVPAELNMDHTVVLQLAEEHLLKEGMAWLDTQAVGEAQYWLPALFTELYSQEITPEEAKEAIP
ncbi:vacuolar-sorting protein SNF8 isoform X2 [Apus apus]|uniref:vacuolar-sorting protein SNF8 isoform X2 n=1 Tax=Apus apus TaxID=8895 RepID=UPI0021F8160F|nr:vacuolar-sorting protein SNF8 isoform X2 [Apus apus]